MSQTPAVQIENLSHQYGERVALDQISLLVREREIFGLLGPNGGGKTTLFRVLSTLFPAQSGSASLCGKDLSREAHEVRRSLGVVFQSASLDKKLTVAENLTCQGSLYGLSGAALRKRIADLLAQFNLSDRAKDAAETLSGGLQRRVEIAKALLHEPSILLMDEPSTGLDPGARIDLWALLDRLRNERGVTVLLTTHLMEEAERCDRLAILNRGKIVALGSPAELKGEIGGDILTLRCSDPEQLAADIKAGWGLDATILEGSLRLEHSDAQTFLSVLLQRYPKRFDSVAIGKPTLEDLFIRRTGHRMEMAHED